MSPGAAISIPSAGAAMKSVTLWVTIASPFRAASMTISSSASRNTGRTRKYISTGSQSAARALMTAATSSRLCPGGRDGHRCGPGLRSRQRPVVDPGATQYYLDAREAPVTVKSSISLTDEQHAFARALVEAGRYSSLSAVLQQGFDLLRRRIDAEELETASVAGAPVPPPPGRVRRREGDGRAAGRDGCRQAPRAWPSVLSSRRRPNATSG